jgi:hypothetical protein
VVSCEHGNEPSGSVKGWEFLDKLTDYQLLWKDSAAWTYLLSVLEKCGGKVWTGLILLRVGIRGGIL